jgi:Holliday junction resolvase RusA-like endonuclease
METVTDGKRTSVRFVVPGEPVAWERAGIRMARGRSGKVFPQHYTPKATRNYEVGVAVYAKLAMAGRKPLCGGLILLVHAFFTVPVSWPKWKQREAIAGVIVPTGRPDWDNVGKGCSDAMNKIVFDDDSAVVDALVRKRFSTEPRVVIEVRTLDPAREREPDLLDVILARPPIGI